MICHVQRNAKNNRFSVVVLKAEVHEDEWRQTRYHTQILMFEYLCTE